MCHLGGQGPAVAVDSQKTPGHVPRIRVWPSAVGLVCAALVGSVCSVDGFAQVDVRPKQRRLAEGPHLCPPCDLVRDCEPHRGGAHFPETSLRRRSSA